MIKEKIPELKNFNKQQKLDLAKELWDEVHDDVNFELTEEQKNELDRRLQYYKDHPDNTVPWEEVQENLKKIYK